MGKELIEFLLAPQQSISYRTKDGTFISLFSSMNSLRFSVWSSMKVAFTLMADVAIHLQLFCCFRLCGLCLGCLNLGDCYSIV